MKKENSVKRSFAGGQIRSLKKVLYCCTYIHIVPLNYIKIKTLKIIIDD